MKCKDCEYLTIEHQDGWYMEILCEKYNLTKIEAKGSFKYLTCFENQKNYCAKMKGENDEI